MPTYSIKAPNGKTYEIEGPAGASDAQVRAQVLAQYPDAAKAAPATPPTKYDPSEGIQLRLPGTDIPLVNPFTMQPFGDTAGRFMAGMGQSFNKLGNLFRSDEAVAEQKRLEQPLMDTTAGTVGSVAGDVVQAAALSPVVRGGAAAVSTAAKAPKLAAYVQSGKFVPTAATEAVTGAALGAAQAAPEDRLGEALSQGAWGVGGAAIAPAVGKIIAPFRKMAGTTGERALQTADAETIARVLGEDVSKALPVSGQLAGEAAHGPLRAEIAQRNVPVLGSGMKESDKTIRDAFTRYLFQQTGVDVADKAVGPQAFRAMDDALRSTRDTLESTLAARGNVKTSDLADNLLGVQRNLADTRLPSERAAAEAATRRAQEAADAAASRATDARVSEGAGRAKFQEGQAKTQAALADAVEKQGNAAATLEEAWKEADRLGAGDLFNEATKARRAAAEARMSGSEEYPKLRAQWEVLRKQLQEVSPELAKVSDEARQFATIEKTVNRLTEAAAKPAPGGSSVVGRAEAAVANKQAKLAEELAGAKQNTGWGDFDKLVEDATRPKELTGADITALRTRANDLFEEVRTGQGVTNKSAKLDALRNFKSTIDAEADRVLGGASPISFADLARQEGMASTLRAARDTAGHGSFSPKAIADELEKTFGPKTAAKEKLAVQELSGALERRAGGSFAAGPEQYKALMAGMMMGEVPISGLRGLLTSIGGRATLGTKLGRDYMVANPWRGEAADQTKNLIRALMTGSNTNY